MEQQFAALFSGLRQKLASSELANVRGDDDAAGGDPSFTGGSFFRCSPLSPSSSGNNAKTKSQTPHKQNRAATAAAQQHQWQQQPQPENELLVRVQPSFFFDQRKLLKAEHAAIARLLEERARMLREVHAARAESVADARAMLEARIREVRDHAQGVDQLRRWQDRTLLFQAQLRIRQLLEQCRGEIAKETRRMRAHNRLQVETLSGASLAVRQVAAVQSLLAALVHEAAAAAAAAAAAVGTNASEESSVSVNSIGIVAHARGSHLPHEKERERLAAARGGAGSGASSSESTDGGDGSSADGAAAAAGGGSSGDAAGASAGGVVAAVVAAAVVVVVLSQ